MKKSFIGTFDELAEKLDFLLKEGKTIKNVEYVGYLTQVPSLLTDNNLHVFIIETKDNG